MKKRHIKREREKLDEKECMNMNNVMERKNYEEIFQKYVMKK